MSRQMYPHRGSAELDCRLAHDGSGNRVSVNLDCPKRMIYGPCGGVRPDGQCEMRPGPCSFPVPVAYVGQIERRPMPGVPRVLTDVSAPPFDDRALAQVCQMLASGSEALLVGEHHNRPDFPPTMIASILLANGATPWITLACRDRNRVVLEQELRGLLHLGVETVLCVTGDGRGPDVRPDVTQVFDLDGPRLAALATRIGLHAAVPETPLAPPAALRATRLVIKQAAGAAVAVLNHVPTAADVASFVRIGRECGLQIPIIAAVAVYTDAQSAAALGNLPGLQLDQRAVEKVLTAADPVTAGIETAVREAHELLAIDGVAGVNVSGLASGRGWQHATEIKAAIGEHILEGASS